MTPDFWHGKSVFVTGHTGFKGGWISRWLSDMGARVHGYALEPPPGPGFFRETQLERRLACSNIGDIRNLDSLTKSIDAAQPEILFHMAAQPLVRASYALPKETFETNVMGTVNVLEAALKVDSLRAVVNITTDKCYENKEWHYGYRETDPLGGRDPYSASKAGSELVTAAYRDSFFSKLGIGIASARAGNVIGGGDWAVDRLIPDFLRALDAGEILQIRSPTAIRPWQHVLEPLSGYLLLANALCEHGAAYANAWNFGPRDADAKCVGWVVDKLCALNPGSRWESVNSEQPHEAGLLKLDSSRATALLGWAPRWNLETALTKTVEWHHLSRDRADMDAVTGQQIEAFSRL